MPPWRPTRCIRARITRSASRSRHRGRPTRRARDTARDELNPNFGPAFNDMSYLEINAGRPDEAFAWAKRAFRLAPNLPNSHYHVAAPVAYLDEQAAERFLLAAARRFRSPTASADTESGCCWRTSTSIAATSRAPISACARPWRRIRESTPWSASSRRPRHMRTHRMRRSVSTPPCSAPPMVAASGWHRIHPGRCVPTCFCVTAGAMPRVR